MMFVIRNPLLLVFEIQGLGLIDEGMNFFFKLIPNKSIFLLIKDDQ